MHYINILTYLLDQSTGLADSNAPESTAKQYTRWDDTNSSFKRQHSTASLVADFVSKHSARWAGCMNVSENLSDT